MSIEKKRQSTTVYVRKCDVCGNVAKRRCQLCDQDLCVAHVVYDPDDWSDYPQRFCERCWNLPERTRLHEARLAWCEQEERLENELKVAAKKGRA